MSLVDTTSAGNGNFIQTLQLLANPEEVQKRFQALVEQQAKTEKLLALVGPANEILALRKQIEKDVAEAKEVLVAARAQAADIAAEAAAKAEEISKAAQAEANTARTEAQAALNAARAAQARAAEKEAEAERLQAVLKEKIADANAETVRMERLAVEHEEAKLGYAQSLRALKDIAGQFATVLGKF